MAVEEFFEAAKGRFRPKMRSHLEILSRALVHT
jgi:hypothetical protein